MSQKCSDVVVIRSCLMKVKVGLSLARSKMYHPPTQVTYYYRILYARLDVSFIVSYLFSEQLLSKFVPQHMLQNHQTMC